MTHNTYFQFPTTNHLRVSKCVCFPNQNDDGILTYLRTTQYVSMKRGLQRYR